MTVLVAYATRYGATVGIAERIAATLTAAGHEAHALPVEVVRSLANVEAVVVGSAVYFGSWLKPAAAFVEQHRAALAELPVWLFSSGPLPGAVVPEKTAEETEGGEQPKQIDELRAAVGALGHQVFDGALDPKKLGVRDRLIRSLPAGKPLLPEVDGRDWAAIDEWAAGIAADLDALGRSAR
jgi:menaquinone-dependent protoporphyrinogen oxidase